MESTKGDRFSHVDWFGTSISFLLGIIGGVIIVSPAIMDDVRSFLNEGSINSGIGTVLVGGIVSLVLIVFGIWALFMTFTYIDR